MGMDTSRVTQKRKKKEKVAYLACYVVELTEAYHNEVIRGDDGLTKYSAVLSWGHTVCLLRVGRGSRECLVQTVTMMTLHELCLVPKVLHSVLCRQIMRSCHAVPAVCTDVQTVADASCAAMHIAMMMCQMARSVSVRA